MSAPELSDTFECFGSHCTIHVTGAGAAGSPAEAVSLAREQLLAWHRQFSRFLPDSELSRLNRDPREVVPVSPLMARLAAAVQSTGALTDGLVDGTLVDEIERAGYARDLGQPLRLETALELAPARRPAAPAAARHWQQIEVDLTDGTVRRPPGVKLDSGGLAKGLFADVLAERLSGHRLFAVNCAGDLAIGGAERRPRPIEVVSPFDGHILHTFRIATTGVATSGIGRRSWLDARGRPAHHLLDPARGTPAFTGIVQVTALADSTLLAEAYAKAAILSGPQRASRWLPAGGVIVLDDGSHHVIEPPHVVSLGELSMHASRRAAPRPRGRAR